MSACSSANAVPVLFGASSVSFCHCRDCRICTQTHARVEHPARPQGLADCRPPRPLHRPLLELWEKWIVFLGILSNRLFAKCLFARDLWQPILWQTALGIRGNRFFCKQCMLLLSKRSAARWAAAHTQISGVASPQKRRLLQPPTRDITRT